MYVHTYLCLLILLGLGTSTCDLDTLFAFEWRARINSSLSRSVCEQKI